MKIIDSIPKELLDATNEFSKKLEWARRLPVYEVHKWWARRYSGIVRLFLAFNELDEDVLNRVNDYNEFVKTLYLNPPKVNGKKLLDPFCGGGTILIESSKLGYNSYGIEINKLPCLVLNSIKEIPKLELEVVEEKIIQTSKKLKKIWTTKCSLGHDALIIHTFLAWKNKRGELQVRINELDDKRKIYFCEKCGRLYQSKKELEKCKFCGNMFNKIYDKIEYAKLVPYAIEYFCPICNKRDFKAITNEDQKKFYLNFKIRSIKIPPLKETNRLLRAGLERFDQLLTPRQRLTFKVFLNSFKTEPYKNLAKIMVSDSLRSCSLLAYYSPKYRRVIPGFVIKSYWLPVQPVELNPISFRLSSSGELLPLGKGTLISSLRKIKRAKEFIKKQLTPLNFKLYCGPAQDVLPRINETFDVVFTDPPYGDYQFYSDLSLFGLSIIRETNYRQIKELIKKEIVLRERKYLARYKNELFRVLSLSVRKLSESGRMILTFHHSDIVLLYAIMDILKNLPLKLQAIYPVIGESSGRLTKRRLYLDLIFVLGREKRRPYYTFTSCSFTKHDEELQKNIKNLVSYYEEK